MPWLQWYHREDDLTRAVRAPYRLLQPDEQDRGLRQQMPAAMPKRPAIRFADAMAPYRVPIYNKAMAIKSFRSSDTQRLFERVPVRRYAAIGAVARRKLEQIAAAGSLAFLRVPPGNRLELLKGDRAGQHSIRINEQLRIRFRWIGHDAENVEIVDYH
jgi:proteic killer suppression protein